MEFTLTFSDTGLRAEPGSFMNLDAARDAAFDLSIETQAEVAIVCNHGRFCEVVERVFA